MTVGYSLVGYSLVSSYLQQRILSADPFVTLDEEGAGKLIKMTVEQLKREESQINPELKICGDHSDPRSIRFSSSNDADLSYMSASSFSVPIATIAAAYQ